MPVDRPTFHESWYRLAGLCARLRPSLEVYRQNFRGQMWHVVQDPTGNQFYRLNESAYFFIGLLDGRRTVGQAWTIANETLGDAAPTQGEVIDLLGRLYTSNLLLADLPPDAESLFRRFSKRRRRELQGYVTNIMFARFPLFDPDRIVQRLSTAFGWLWSMWGMALWIVAVAVGLYMLLPQWKAFWDLTGREQNFLAPSRLPLLYVGFVIAKIGHEFGHALACKTFGRRSGSGGEVHTMGIMLLVFTPMPYVDASSSWAFRNKWHRVVVGCAGMMVELVIASVAAVIWVINGSVLAHNVVFVAGVSTLLFNANPLLRYDGYYILSDILEIPNLSQRSREYLQYLVRRWVWSVRTARCPAHSRGERIWFVLYGVASTIYRIFIYVSILLFLSDRLPKELVIVAVIFGLLSAVMWLVVPLYKLVRYLIGNNELSRTRGWAALTVLAVVAIVIAAVGVVPFPDRFKLEGVVEPVEISVVHTRTPGFLAACLETEQPVTAARSVLLNPPPSDASLSRDVTQRHQWPLNPDLVVNYEKVRVDLEILGIRRREALEQGKMADAAGLAAQITAVKRHRDRLAEDLADLTVTAPAGATGTWLAWTLPDRVGTYLDRGQAVGMIAGLDKVFIRAAAGQEVAGTLRHAAVTGPLPAEIRVQGRPDILMVTAVRHDQIADAGSVNLPSAALGYSAGGATAVRPDDRTGRTAAVQFFEVRVHPPADAPGGLMPGQRVIVRIEAPPKPLALQWLREIRQLLQRRFGT